MTADGSTLTTSADDHPDLYFAIRGGGGNFGVVTEFVFKLWPQRATVYAGALIFPAPALEKIVEATNKWWKTVTERESMLQVLTVAPDGTVSNERNSIIFVEFFLNFCSLSLLCMFSTMAQNPKDAPSISSFLTLVRLSTTQYSEWPTS